MNIASKISPSYKNFDSYLPLISTISDENSVTEEKLKKTSLSTGTFPDKLKIEKVPVILKDAQEN